MTVTIRAAAKIVGALGGWDYEIRDSSGRFLAGGWVAGSKREAKAEAREALSKLAGGGS